MTETEDHRSLRSKRKAITAFLPYAVRQERDGHPEMLDTIFHAVRASKMVLFMWRYAETGGDLVQWWAATTLAVPHTEDVAQSVVDTLLQIARRDELVWYIPTDLWSWLTKRSSQVILASCLVGVGYFLRF